MTDLFDTYKVIDVDSGSNLYQLAYISFAYCLADFTSGVIT